MTVIFYDQSGSPITPGLLVS